MSHYIPSGVFKVVGRGGPDHESQSVFMDVNRGTANYSNFQPKKKLLCGECEGKFSKWGENPVIPSLLTHTGFPLRDVELASVADGLRMPLESSYSVDYQSYAYFALSIIWRGSVTLWPASYNRIRTVYKRSVYLGFAQSGCRNNMYW